MKRPIITLLLTSLVGLSSAAFAGEPELLPAPAHVDTSSDAQLLLLGGRIGWQDYYSELTLGTPPNTASTEVSITGMQLGPFLKYGWIHNHLFLGVEGFFNYSFARSTNNLVGTVNPNYTYGVSFQPGYALTPMTIFYARIGGGIGHVKNTSEDTLNGFKSTQGLFLLGFGINQAIYKRDAYLGIDYDHTFAPSFTATSATTPGDLYQVEKSNGDSVSLSLSYNFFT